MPLPLPLNESADEDVMRRFAQGEVAGFEVLYDRHSKRIWRYFYRNGMDEAQAEDLGQDLWLAVVDHAANYEVRSKFTTWLFTMAHHRLVDQWRKQRRFMVSIESEEGQLLAEALFEASGFGPEQMLHRKQAAEQLLTTLASLPAEQRSSFLLQAEAGMSVLEIAQATGVSAETAKSRLRYAREKLRLALEETAT